MVFVFTVFHSTKDTVNEWNCLVFIFGYFFTGILGVQCSSSWIGRGVQDLTREKAGKGGASEQQGDVEDRDRKIGCPDFYHQNFKNVSGKQKRDLLKSW